MYNTCTFFVTDSSCNMERSRESMDVAWLSDGQH